MTDRLTKALIEQWLATEEDEFNIKAFREKHNINPENDNLYRAFDLLMEEKVLRRLKRGWYRKVKPAELIKWWNGEELERLPIVWPYGVDDFSSFGFDESIEVYPGDTIVVAGDSNWGKGHPLGTKILTDDGFRNIEDLSLGDFLLTPLGDRTKIVGLFKRAEQQVYAFKFTDGSQIEVDIEHLWKIQSNYQRQKLTGHGNVNLHQGEWLVKNTKDIIARYGLGNVYKYKLKIPRTKAIQHFGFQLKVNFPRYLLGLILGDGCLTGMGIRFSTKDKQLLDYLASIGVDYIHRGRYDYKLNLGKYAHKLPQGIKRPSHEKFIPIGYLLGTKSQRLAILQGLMDTDGWVQSNKTYFCSASKQLAKDVMFLVESLGGKASLREKIPSYTYNNETRIGRKSFVIYIRFQDICPFRLRRKRVDWKPYKKPMERIIKSIDYVGKKKTICIAIDDKDGLYIAQDFIVTHNTTFALNFLINNLHLFQGARLMVNEYKPQRFRARMKKMDWVDYWNENKPRFDTIAVTQNHIDYIMADYLNAIDWLHIKSEFWGIAELIEAMQIQLRLGILLLVIQKTAGKTKGIGGDWGKFFPAVYLTIDPAGRLTVEKVKSSPVSVPNPEGKVFGFDIIESGSRFHNIREVQICRSCKGNRFIFGEKCRTCYGKGYVEKQ